MNPFVWLLGLTLGLALATPAGPGGFRPKMFIRLLPIGVVATCMAACGWLDPFHLVVAAIVLVALRIVDRISPTPKLKHQVHRDKLVRDVRDITELDDEPLEPRGRLLLRAVARGILTFAIVAAVSWVASIVPGIETLAFDRDRTQVELKLDALEQAGDDSAAADLITHRLEQRTSRPWRKVLAERLYQSLIRAGTRAAGDQTEAFFRQAVQAADEHGLDRGLAATHLERLRVRRQLDSQVVTHRHQTESLQQDLGRAQADVAQVQRRHAEAIFRLLLDWADSLEPSNPLRRAKYFEAETFAKQHGLPTALVQSRITELEQALARQQPAVLPTGARAVIQRLDDTTAAPLYVVDVTVQLATGEPLTGLTIKDFRLQLDDGTVVHPLAISNRTAVSEPIQLVLLIDCSNSTAGPALAAAKAGGADTLQQLDGVAEVKVIAFGTTLSVISDWTVHPAAAIPGLQQLTTAGNTALRRALAQAAAELKGRRRPKAIIVFTDGHDTVGGPSMADLAADCQKAAIVIHVVALETAELDRDSLAQITLTTGGLLLPASNVNDLPHRFRQAANALQYPYYRLIFADVAADSWEMSVGGGENAVHVTHCRTEPQPNETQQTSN